MRPVHRWKIRKLSLISIFLVLVKRVYPSTHGNGRISSRFSQVSKNDLNKPSRIKLLQAIIARGNNGAGKIKQDWTGRGDLNISFCVIVDHYCQTLFLGGGNFALALRDNVFCTRCHIPHSLWWIEAILKSWNVSKCYVRDCKFNG